MFPRSGAGNVRSSDSETTGAPLPLACTDSGASQTAASYSGNLDNEGVVGGAGGVGIEGG